MINGVHSFACISSVFGGRKKKSWGEKYLRKLISRCICKAFWDTRTPGGSCLCTINNFPEFVLGFLWQNRRSTWRFVFLWRWLQIKRWEIDERWGAGFIYNGWLVENGNWLFFILPVVVKEAPVTIRAESPGRMMFPWQPGISLHLSD